MFRINPLHPLFAAEVTDFDLSTPPSEATFAALDAAFERHLVLVFRDQNITDAQQIAFSEGFGPLETTKVGTPGAGSALIVLTNIGADGEIEPPQGRQVLNNKANQHWHTDSSFKPVPARASLLSSRILPTSGGNTEFISMRAVYAALPEGMKRRIDGRVGIHDFAYGRAKIAPHLVTDEERAALPPVRQAMVLDHGVYGKSLYLGAHCAVVADLPAEEGRDLIDGLMAFAAQDRFIYSHDWRPHDLVMWHNRAVLHRATPFDSAAEKRYMVRTTVAGDGPTL